VNLPSLEIPPRIAAELGPMSGRGVRIGIVDSGLDPALRGPNVSTGVGIVTSQDDLVSAKIGNNRDHIGHGTACADIVHSMAPGATLVPIRVFHDRLKTSIEALVAAIRWAAERGLRVLNLSLGSVREDALKPIYLACEEARRHGMVIVAATAAANDFAYPAVFDCVIGVKGGYFDNIYDFEFRPEAAVECVAQSYRHVRALDGKPRIVNSYSFSSPHITAIVALLLEKHPDADLKQIREQLGRCSITRRGPAQEARYGPTLDPLDADGTQP